MNRIRLCRALAALGCAVLPAVSQAAQCAKESPPHAVALLELYTSEGCSSCPPADRWFSRLGRELIADRVVPLALHVDYWDRLGWKDRLADARFSARQSALAGLGGSRVVYTPGVFLNLRELRGWRSPASFDQSLKTVNARKAGADIRIELDTPAPAHIAIKAEFRIGAGVPAKQPRAFVALYENGLSSDASRTFCCRLARRKHRLSALSIPPCRATSKPFASSVWRKTRPADTTPHLFSRRIWNVA